MLDHNDRVSLLHQFVQHFEQFCYVVEMQAGGGFVKNIERAASCAARQFLGKLHTLRFAAGKRRRLAGRP